MITDHIHNTLLSLSRIELSSQETYALVTFGHPLGSDRVELTWSFLAEEFGLVLLRSWLLMPPLLVAEGKAALPF